MANGIWPMTDGRRLAASVGNHRPFTICPQPSAISHIKVASDFLGHPDDLDHLGDRVHPDDMCAGQHGGGHGSGGPPIAFGSGPAAGRVAQK